ncbi:hypothetical protein GO986_18670 [Deinococcus sp. HMF7620]|uniref:Uncharacterized protein n=1 Tax=Deinococcus arboris TaxID=2682977 RepID=A0A7C9IE34_9DEIO|nr:hypothetical protein [Deinococcus arboris]MVN88766.1 hypothetical protein [Deinococcus arboris]
MPFWQAALLTYSVVALAYGLWLGRLLVSSTGQRGLRLAQHRSRRAKVIYSPWRLWVVAFALGVQWPALLGSALWRALQQHGARRR